ncbi:hypothetical protein MHUMG1_06717 [Metarhizium humberi]|uniref:Uncharacterized protein n=1 Tax=Metarhizium humberi TaxID=2596975 RepID=A0A9P8M8M2_9HYPO|nr:hypothetical protein MHUMG1_06717 [Metarhizium humberi]
MLHEPLDDGGGLAELGFGQIVGNRASVSTGCRRTTGDTIGVNWCKTSGNIWLAIVTLEGATVVLDDLTFRKGKRPVGRGVLKAPTRKIEKDKKANSSRINNSAVVQVPAETGPANQSLGPRLFAVSIVVGKYHQPFLAGFLAREESCASLSIDIQSDVEVRVKGLHNYHASSPNHTCRVRLKGPEERYAVDLSAAARFQWPATSYTQNRPGTTRPQWSLRLSDQRDEEKQRLASPITRSSTRAGGV